MRQTSNRTPDVSIVVPVFNRLEFTRQCLERVERNTSSRYRWRVLVVDNASTDGTREWFETSAPRFVEYHRNEENVGFARANNQGARLANGRHLLFLNNDTLPQPGWLDAMVETAEADPKVGIVGLKQLFPYTNLVHHVGIVFTRDRHGEPRPAHLYPYEDARSVRASKQREYQAVTGSCLLIPRDLFEECGGFDETYVNGYEDVDLCLTVRERGRKVVCCTRSFIYHYGQITLGRGSDDDANAAHFFAKWAGRLVADEEDYAEQDAGDPAIPGPRPARVADDAVHFAIDVERGNSFTWVTAELALALDRQGVPVTLSRSRHVAVESEAERKILAEMMVDRADPEAAQIKWSHYWPYLWDVDLTGRANFEIFVINYEFANPGSQPWDPWMQSIRQNHYVKLALSGYCQKVLGQVGIPVAESPVLPLGYSREIDEVLPIERPPGPVRLLTVTNSHDLGRYNTFGLLDAYWKTFHRNDPVTLVVKDYGAHSGNRRLRDFIYDRPGRARVEYVSTFTSKKDLIRLYRTCDAIVSPHRGEGFAMKILDAMACGMPAVMPLYGGPTEYANAENTYAVDYALAPVGDCTDRESLYLTNGPTWCEPDLGSLAAQMRAVVEDRSRARAVGERAARDVRERFHWDRIAERLLGIVGAAEERRQAA